MNTSCIISIINTIFVAEGWYHFLGKNPNVYSIMTSGVCCTCIPLCMEMLLDTFCKFLSYSLCNCWTEGLFSRHWHSLLERWIGYYISCLVLYLVLYFLFLEDLLCFIYTIYLFYHIHHKCSAVLAILLYFSVSEVWYCTLQEQGAIVFIVILTLVSLNNGS